ncbi:4Fe-4S binding protein [Persephonella sp.]
MKKTGRIRLNISECVRIYYRDSSCSECLKVCPVNGAIYQDDYKVFINNELCVSCGACSGVCPSQAFEFDGFSPEELVKRISTTGETVSCKTNIPCLSALSVEHLIAAALNSQNDIILDTGHCRECFIGSLLEEIERKKEEANYVLERLGVENRVVTQELSLQPEKKEEKKRREFLKNFGKAAAGLTFWALAPRLSSFEEEDFKPKNIVEEKVNIPKRKLLIESLKAAQPEPSTQLETEKISFTSDKWIDNSKCTNCSVCYNVCPTGALKPGEERLKILFEPKLCIKCGICHEICPEDCLHLEEKITLGTFLNETKVLAEHVMIPCEECLVPFSYKGDTTLCPRCRQLEDEIRDLLQLGE